MAQKTLPDVFVEGARKGWNLGINSLLPNVVMAFTVIYFLKVTGLLTIIGKVFGPLMVIFGLPGEAAMVFLAALPSNAGGIGVMLSLYTAGVVNDNQVTIMLPGIFLMGAQLQFMGRCLGTMEVNTRLYPALFVICYINSAVAMFIMKFVMVFV
jgi:spore maturation protein SpmB